MLEVLNCLKSLKLQQQELNIKTSVDCFFCYSRNSIPRSHSLLPNSNNNKRFSKLLSLGLHCCKNLRQCTSLVLWTSGLGLADEISYPCTQLLLDPVPTTEIALDVLQITLPPAELDFRALWAWRLSWTRSLYFFKNSLPRCFLRLVRWWSLVEPLCWLRNQLLGSSVDATGIPVVWRSRIRSGLATALKPLYQ